MPVARLRGVVDEKGADWVIVSVGGLGLMASVPATTADALERGAPATLYTHLHVREDALALFGFATPDDLALFEQLIGVSGIGPRAALGLLSAMDQPALATAIASGRVDALRKVPGIGQKTAERIVLELRDKVVPGESVQPQTEAKSEPDRDLIAALLALGYSQSEAAAASDALPARNGAPLEDRVREALGYFSGS